MDALDRSQAESALGNTRRAAAATKPFGAKQVCANGHRWSRVLAAHLAVSVVPLDCVRARVRAPFGAGSALEYRRRACKFCIPALVCVVCEVCGRRHAGPDRTPSTCGTRSHARCVHSGCAPSAQRLPRNSSVQRNAQKGGHARTATITTCSATHLSVCCFTRCFSSHHRLVERHDGRIDNRKDMAGSSTAGRTAPDLSRPVNVRLPETGDKSDTLVVKKLTSNGGSAGGKLGCRPRTTRLSTPNRPGILNRDRTAVCSRSNTRL